MLEKTKKTRKHIQILDVDTNILIDKIHFDSEETNGKLFVQAVDLVQYWCKVHKFDYNNQVFWNWQGVKESEYSLYSI